MKLAAVLALLVGAALTSCSDESLPCPQADRDPAILLGIGSERDAPWAPWQDGGDAIVEPGSQGGFHVWAQLRTEGICADDARVELAAHVGDDDVLLVKGSLRLAPPWHPEEDDATFRAAQVILCPPPDGVNIIGQVVRVSIAVEDSGGRRAETQTEIVVRCPGPDVHVDIPTTCRRICDYDFSDE